MNPEKKSKTRDRHRARSTEKNPERRIASFCICSHALDFFPDIALGDGPKNSRIRVKRISENFNGQFTGEKGLVIGASS